ncbi:hypothetical protein QAD02_019701 [Eretmocerus hayati]|uniref:Uncharacterized protein n=1 Tax=Eretmocerus hayati TaxID=131215 RepID=A0ACC2PKW5_9HYME|nr:hypothetical protein QAD02_019701 [Eretmocerus hayati]
MLSLLLMLGSRALLSTVVRASSADDDDDDVTVENEEATGAPSPTKEQLLAAIQAMKDLSEEEKKQLMDSIISGNPGAGSKSGLPVADDLLDEEGNRHLATSMFASQFFILVAMLSLITLIFVFFGYKLYKSLDYLHKIQAVLRIRKK